MWYFVVVQLVQGMDHNAEFRTLLDDISTCFIARRFTTWRDRVLLPFSLITQDGPLILRDDVALRRNFDLYLQACSAMQLDEVYREAKQLEACPDGTWIGTYETNLLRHGHRATDPYLSSALLHVVDGQFKMSSILNARGHTTWTGIAPDPHTARDKDDPV